MLTDKEKQILALLAEAYNLFVELESSHPWDNQEFMHAIHAAQNIVLSQPPVREIRETSNITVFYVGQLLKHNFDPGVFRVTGVSENEIWVYKVEDRFGSVTYVIPQVLRYHKVGWRSAWLM